MASGSEDEQQGAWYFGSNSYVPKSSSESEEEPQNMEEIGPHQQNQHKPRLMNELRQLIFQDMLSLKEANKPYIVESKFKNCGKKRVVVPPNLLESRPIGEHTCIRDVATCLDLAPSTVWRLIKRGEIKTHSNPLHSALTDANKIRGVEWILSLIQEDTIQRHPIYKVMYDYIHIDEKWFYLTKKMQRVYLAHKEKVPYRATKSSKFIPKAMFLGIVARPRWNRFGQCTFDGKIRIFPFINMVAAQRDSKNRPRGSIEIKPTESVNQEVYRSMLIQQLILTILRKWPSEGPSIIFIQQDNARVHIINDDLIWQQHNRQGGLTFILTQQPPNSSDSNILDLGFFRSIQSLMHKKMPKNITELITAVEDAFGELHP
ncbi:uncharacterized protein LOC130813569 [Amaranthus tricolor]|uniref:uncharacterized protein LOC130813569 n=1 Tax=Amaranthus tricolor TaxID=29722 RepID=UPI0025837E3D|nr:uncharacterized protein LOC130813569 [Amaranthus tricolor]